MSNLVFKKKQYFNWIFRLWLSKIIKLTCLFSNTKLIYAIMIFLDEVEDEGQILYLNVSSYLGIILVSFTLEQWK